jgi:hypothetical protein
MTKNLLDLRKKGIDKVRVVEHIIFKPRSFKYEMIKMFSVIVIVTAIGFGVSKADNIPALKNIKDTLNGDNSQLKTSSIFGQIQEINESSVSIQKIVDKSLQEDVYAVDVTDATFQTSDYTYLSFSDLKIGDKIIVKGFLKQETYLEAKKIFVFPLSEEERLEFEALLATTEESPSSTDEIATTTATTTLETETSTNENSTTTEESASSTDSIIDTATGIIENIVETVVDTVNNVIDTVTGNTEEPVVEESAPVEPETAVTEPEPELIETEEVPAQESVPEPVSEPVTE